MRELGEGPSLPDNFITDPAEGGYIQGQIETFFIGVLDFLGYNQRAREAFAKIESFELKTPTHETGNRLTLLTVQGRVAATVYAHTTDFNYVEVVFAH